MGRGAAADASVGCWTSGCLAEEEKTPGRKCFLQLLGVSFPTLRPTKRQTAAKSRERSAAAEMPFSLTPGLSKHSTHTRQRAEPLNPQPGDGLHNNTANNGEEALTETD